jgi:hypothetical protein
MGYEGWHVGNKCMILKDIRLYVGNVAEIDQHFLYRRVYIDIPYTIQ